eukprot:scaffold3849_cov179-Amphora_coffeaeformis.AAC.33
MADPYLLQLTELVKPICFLLSGRQLQGSLPLVAVVIKPFVPYRMTAIQSGALLERLTTCTPILLVSKLAGEQSFGGPTSFCSVSALRCLAEKKVFDKKTTVEQFCSWGVEVCTKSMYEFVAAARKFRAGRAKCHLISNWVPKLSVGAVIPAPGNSNPNFWTRHCTDIIGGSLLMLL